MIKAGLQLVISSWENDGDNYKDVTISGLSEARTKMIISICKEFTSNKFGNMRDDNVDVASNTVVTILEDNIDVLEADELACAREEICEYMSTYLGSSEFYDFRVFDSFKVFYIPQDIDEVTSYFQ